MASDNSFSFSFDDSFSVDDLHSDAQVSKLKYNALMNLDLEFNPEALNCSLQECLATCAYKQLDDKIFKETLPIAYNFLFELIEKIRETTDSKEGALQTIKEQLYIAHELLGFWQKCAEHVSNLQGANGADVKTLIENLPEAVKLIFEHCKQSPKIYGNSSVEVSEELRNLFRKANTVLRLFLATLESVIVFDTDVESETKLLGRVIDVIGSIAIVANGMDLKTFVETSKSFGKLAFSHQNAVKRVSPRNITLHVEQLAKNLASTISSFMDPHEDVDDRTIKAAGLLLKILDKLFAAYGSCLTQEILISAIELLVQVHNCSPSRLKALAINEKTIDLINTQIHMGSESLLSTLFKSIEFKQAYFDYYNQVNIDKLGFHMLTINIMRNLINMPYEHHCKWTFGAESIIDVAMTNINYLQEEICAGEVRLQGASDVGERPRLASIYESTLVAICSLISQVPADSFYVVELLLLKYLLGNQLWSSLLATDIWCFIGRLGSSDLCVSHVKYLLRAYAALIKRRNSQETVILENLIQRLYALLSEETKHSLVVDFEDLDSHLWIPIARLLPLKTKLFLQNRLASTLNEIPGVFHELQRQPNVQNWTRLEMLMLFVSKLHPVENKNLIVVLSEIWNIIANTIENFEGKELDILSDFITNLLNASQPGSQQNNAFLSILKVLTHFPSHMKVITSYYLRDNMDAFGECDTNMAAILAELNCRLLEDENPWVRQEALESFDHIAHTCPNEDLVTKMAAAITKKPSISESLPAYLSGVPFYKLRDYLNVELYLRHLAKDFADVGHVCYQYVSSERCDKIAKMEMIEKPIEVIDRRVDRICDELNNILTRRNEITDNSLRRLRVTCEKILTIAVPK